MTRASPDRAIVEAMQSGLPLIRRSFAEGARAKGFDETKVIEHMAAMPARSVIRRIAVAPNHYRLGMTAIGTKIRDVGDTRLPGLGSRIDALRFVTHNYLRSPSFPDWPYSLFAMVHGSSRDKVEAKRQELAALLGAACRGAAFLDSTRLLKQIGLLLARSKD